MNPKLDDVTLKFLFYKVKSLVKLTKFDLVSFKNKKNKKTKKKRNLI